MLACFNRFVLWLCAVFSLEWLHGSRLPCGCRWLILSFLRCCSLPKPFYSKHTYEAKAGSRTAQTPNSGLVLLLPQKHVEPWPPMAITVFSSLSTQAFSPTFSWEDVTIFWRLVRISHLLCGPRGLTNQLRGLDGTPGASEKLV